MLCERQPPAELSRARSRTRPIQATSRAERRPSQPTDRRYATDRPTAATSAHTHRSLTKPPGSLSNYTRLDSITASSIIPPPMEYCDDEVCLSVRDHISRSTRPTFTKILWMLRHGRGSVLLWWRSDRLCTSGFMDDVRHICS